MNVTCYYVINYFLFHVVCFKFTPKQQAEVIYAEDFRDKISEPVRLWIEDGRLIKMSD